MTSSTAGTLTYATSWSKTLVKAINTGTYKSQAASWISCSSVKTAEMCALAWATDSNAFICSEVLAGGISSVEDKELSGAYFTKSSPIVSEQIAKGKSGHFLGRSECEWMLTSVLLGGYRLGDWLNKLHAAQK